MSTAWSNQSNGVSVTTNATTTWTASWLQEPVVYTADGSVVFNPLVMAVDLPYPYRWHGEWQAVVKRADGSLEFYSFKRQRRPRWFGRSEGR